MSLHHRWGFVMWTGDWTLGGWTTHEWIVVEIGPLHFEWKRRRRKR